MATLFNLCMTYCFPYVTRDVFSHHFLYTSFNLDVIGHVINNLWPCLGVNSYEHSEALSSKCRQHQQQITTLRRLPTAGYTLCLFLNEGVFDLGLYGATTTYFKKILFSAFTEKSLGDISKISLFLYPLVFLFSFFKEINEYTMEDRFIGDTF